MSRKNDLKYIAECILDRKIREADDIVFKDDIVDETLTVILTATRINTDSELYQDIREYCYDYLD